MVHFQQRGPRGAIEQCGQSFASSLNRSKIEKRTPSSNGGNDDGFTCVGDLLSFRGLKGKLQFVGPHEQL